MMKKFYISAIDGKKKYVICGPFFTHSEALELVGLVRNYAYKIDPRSHFMSWGTCSSSSKLKCPFGPNMIIVFKAQSRNC